MRPATSPSPRPGAKAWGEFFELLHAVEVSADFMAERPLNRVPPERGVFDGDAPQRKAAR
jgi:antitoxin VapB